MVVSFEQGHLPLTSELKRSVEDPHLAGLRVTLDPMHVAGRVTLISSRGRILMLTQLDALEIEFRYTGVEFCWPSFPLEKEFIHAFQCELADHFLDYVLFFSIICTSCGYHKDFNSSPPIAKSLNTFPGLDR